MAPTTLIGQRTTTTPKGRTTLAGQPLKMAELISGLDGPVFVERVALFDNRRRTHAKRSIKKALELQVAGTGFHSSRSFLSAQSILARTRGR